MCPLSPAATMPGAYRHRLRVRFVECDPQGVVFNANYFTYFDVAITEFQRDVIGPYSELQESGVEMVVAEARARFHGAACFDEEIDIEVQPARIGNTSLTVGFSVVRDGSLLVEGELRYVFVDVHTTRKRPMPDEVRSALEQWTERCTSPSPPTRASHGTTSSWLVAGADE